MIKRTPTISTQPTAPPTQRDRSISKPKFETRSSTIINTIKASNLNDSVYSSNSTTSSIQTPSIAVKSSKLKPSNSSLSKTQYHSAIQLQKSNSTKLYDKNIQLVRLRLNSKTNLNNEYNENANTNKKKILNEIFYI